MALAFSCAKNNSDRNQNVGLACELWRWCEQRNLSFPELMIVCEIWAIIFQGLLNFTRVDISSYTSSTNDSRNLLFRPQIQRVFRNLRASNNGIEIKLRRSRTDDSQFLFGKHLRFFRFFFFARTYTLNAWNMCQGQSEFYFWLSIPGNVQTTQPKFSFLTTGVRNYVNVWLTQT